VGEFVAACSFKNVEDDFVWAFTRVYGPNFDYIRRLIGEELTGLISWWDVPWCINGDFISKQGLMDLPLTGGTLLGLNSYSRSRIDRFLVSSEWKSNILAYCKRGCLDCVQIIFPSCLIVMA
jgi:hypothetical protein